MPDDSITPNDIIAPITRRQEAIVERFVEVAREAIRRRDFEYAMNACLQLRQAITAGGIALSRALYELAKNMDAFGFDNPSDFWNEVGGWLGRNPARLRHYAMIWEVYESGLVPERYREEMQRLPITVQRLIANRLLTCDFTDEEWGRILRAGTYNATRAVIKEITRTPLQPRESVYRIKPNGDIVVYTRQYPPKVVGYLNVNSDDQVVQMYAEGLVRRAGLLPEERA